MRQHSANLPKLSDCQRAQNVNVPSLPCQLTLIGGLFDAPQHAVPVVCITGLFKLCPLYPHNLDEFNELTSPGDVLDYEGDQALQDRAEVLNPEYDFVSPDLLDLYVTDDGGHQPSYVYRLLAERYHPEDWALE